jgi:hypothetical protein
MCIKVSLKEGKLIYVKSLSLHKLKLTAFGVGGEYKKVKKKMGIKGNSQKEGVMQKTRTMSNF